MKSIVIYYSWTGNTKQIAEAIHSGMKELSDECDIARLGEMDTKELLNYELIGLGSFVSDFQEPAEVTDFINAMPDLNGKYGFSFCTHGTCPGEYISRMVKALRGKGLTVTGWNDWYGSGFIPLMPKPYYTDGHPDEVDLKEARKFGREIMERSQRIAKGETQLVPELPEKEEYDKLYGVPIPPQEAPRMEEFMAVMPELKPIYNAEKCNYPKCTICMDNCPTHSINLSESPQISYETCGPCLVWFCEQLCPTGAIEVDWKLVENKLDSMISLFTMLAEPMKKYKELRHFRSLVAPAEEGQDKQLYKIRQHPRFIMRDGIARLRQ